MKKYKIKDQTKEETIESYVFDANDIIDKEEEVQKKINKAEKKVRKHQKSFGNLLPDFMLVKNLLKDHFRNDYSVDKSTLLLLVAGIAYIVSPIDLIPDFLVGAGYVDDAAIFSMILNKVSKDFVAYKDFKNKK